MTLQELAQALGGVVRVTHGHHWIDTAVGELRAVVIRRRHPRSTAATYDLAVFTPSARELDPLHSHVDAGWRLDDRDLFPHLRHGYEFVGCSAGVLFARTSEPPSLEHIVGALWELVAWARQPWRPLTENDRVADRAKSAARERRQRRQRMLSRLGVVATVVLVATLIRRGR